MLGGKTLCAALCAALPLQALAATVVERVHLPEGWQVTGEPAGDHTMMLHIGLKQQNLDTMIERLYEVSDPDSPSYGKHYKHHEVLNLVKPTKEANDKIVAWLQGEEGVKSVHSDGHWVDFESTVATANRLLGTTFKHYKHENGEHRLRTTQYSVPDDLADFVDIISPTTYFSRMKANLPVPDATPTLTKKDEKVARSAPAASCSTSITPACIRELYSVGNYKPDAKSGSVIGFGSFLNQSAIYKDLAIFEAVNDIPQQSFDVITIGGGINNQSASKANVGEANLDVQNIVGVAHPLPVVEFITGGLAPFHPNPDLPTKANASNEPYLKYYTYLLNQPNEDLPQVISNSYGDDEQTVPYKFAQRVCNMIAMMGMRGITIFESSGDTGVGAPCVSNDGTDQPQFTPQFPGTCPYITAVGGTQGIIPERPYEIAWLNGSGGFSDYFTQPAYQVPAINTYFEKYVSKEAKAYQAPYFSRRGRGFPDVSAHSLRPDYQVVYVGALSPSGGTSAAAPVWAGIVGLLNDARLREGKSTLGFLNPFLYKYGRKALNDITAGGSVGCTGTNAQTGTVLKGAKVIPYASWNATIGWDPVTGLGTPNFTKLKNMVVNLPG